jgi:hypothetical protein
MLSHHNWGVKARFFVEHKYAGLIAIAAVTLCTVVICCLVVVGVRKLISSDKSDVQEESRLLFGGDRINGEEVIMIDVGQKAEDEEDIFYNLCLISKNGWNLEVWTDGSVTPPGGGIDIGLRLTKPSGEVNSAPKGHILVQLNGLGGQPSFKGEFDREFVRVHRKSLGFGDAEELGRASLTEPRDGWEASVKNPFPEPGNPKGSVVEALGKYSLKVEVRLQDGTRFVSPLLRIEVFQGRK